ncbi:hypothetical protein GCM10007320_62320 [Pseudorhodoferax aquiterrae]|uniref:Carbohydrate ABC transporter permease n=1 Tax=Pseudorhodoferax aquiterrae TaxID=747304 RepID=A0ABQ3GFB1_9BURK|nr:hypothetical protein GCM10007320_62320 [Pseudorhodoferax aquiterrae]
MRSRPTRAAATACHAEPMNAPKNTPGAVPTSSSRNRHANKRTLTVAAVIVGFLLFAVFFPW